MNSAGTLHGILNRAAPLNPQPAVPDDDHLRHTAIVRMDGSGRFIDLDALKALGWTSGTALHIRRTDNGLAYREAGHPVGGELDTAVDPRNRLFIPRSLRHALALTTGASLLLLATTDGLLVLPAKPVLHHLTQPTKGVRP